MSDRFHAELERMKENSLTMGYLAEDMLRKSVLALEKRDTDLVEWIKSQKKDLGTQNDRIEEEIYSIIALYQPVAKDMRTVACSLRMISASERIGRYGKDIANIVAAIADQPPIGRLVGIPHMADLVLDMIDDALKAYEKEDLSLIQDHSERDDVIDALRHSIFRECITYMMEDPKTITRCTNYVMIARYLERCGDHSCKMAEKIHYMVTGERVEIK
jgi:phosphate transport system protein